MVYTLTFNPSLDYFVTVTKFLTGEINRSEQERIVPGGKGINVSIVLKELGVKSCALGFTAGFTGEELKRLLEIRECQTDFISLIEGNTRINIKIKDKNGNLSLENENKQQQNGMQKLVESDINSEGPSIPFIFLEKLYKKLDQLTPKDVLVLAGSIPNSLPFDVYEQIMIRIKEKKLKIIVDASGELLKRVIPCNPFLVKPNHHELGEIFGVTINTAEKAVICAKKLRKQGASNVLVSMAGAGAVLVTEMDKIYVGGVPDGKMINSVGAGDSMVAGFLAGFLETESYLEAFKMSIAAGSASAFHEWLPSYDEIHSVYSRLPVIEF